MKRRKKVLFPKIYLQVFLKLHLLIFATLLGGIYGFSEKRRYAGILQIITKTNSIVTIHDK
jgi:hypothetical protein